MFQSAGRLFPTQLDSGAKEASELQPHDGCDAAQTASPESKSDLGKHESGRGHMRWKTEVLTIMNARKAKRPLRSPRSVQLEHDALLRLDALFSFDALLALDVNFLPELGLLPPLDLREPRLEPARLGLVIVRVIRVDRDRLERALLALAIRIGSGRYGFRKGWCSRAVVNKGPRRREWREWDERSTWP